MEYIKGADISTLAELENCGARYYDKGAEKGILDILKSYDVNTIRLRLWNDPYSETGEPYGGGGNDLKTTLAIAERVTRAGFSVLLDFHYSDFWADPGKQIKPKAWKHYSPVQLEEAVYEYTLSVMKTFQERKVSLRMVQVGNELSNGLLWEEGRTPHYEQIARFVSAGIRGVRAVDRKVPVMLHLDNGGNNALYREWFDEYLKYGEDFQVIGLSYYPFWHGNLKLLEDNMQDIARRYRKDLVVAEVSMGYTMEDYGDYEKLPQEKRKGYATRKELVEKIDYPMTVEGQCRFMKDFLQVLDRIEDGRGRGFCYWEPAWIPVPGSGWATEASLRYMGAPGPCGNEWANQALFDYDGNALPALEIIKNWKRPAVLPSQPEP